MSSFSHIESQLNQLHTATKSYISELKEAFTAYKTKQPLLLSYFTSSFNLAHHTHADSLCIGSYHIWNVGARPITNPSIQIHLSDETLFSFDGKYLTSDTPRPQQTASHWERTNERTNQKEFHFQLTEPTILLPGDKITFPNFQIRWYPTSSYEGSITGITFVDELSEGEEALNTINVAGFIDDLEMEEQD